MSLMILKNRNSIEAAIATMNPTAREAAQFMAHRLLETPEILDDREKVEEEWLQACAVSCLRNGIHPTDDPERFENWIDNHGQAVLNVAFSIVVFIAEDAKRRQKWGWLGKAAAVAAGIAIGSFFG